MEQGPVVRDRPEAPTVRHDATFFAGSTWMVRISEFELRVPSRRSRSAEHLKLRQRLAPNLRSSGFHSWNSCGPRRKVRWAPAACAAPGVATSQARIRSEEH